jgi:tRNA(Met) C34 N-acetyltransferase TmcA
MILEHSIAPRHVAMVKKRVDARVRTLIENGVRLQHRSLFVLVGDKGKDQVVTLHYMLNKAQARGRPSVLWCYKKELGFSRYGVRTLRSLRPGPRPRASYHHMCLSMPVDPCHSTLSVSAPVPPACVHRPWRSPPVPPLASHRKKRMKQIKKAIQRGLMAPDQDDPFELFVSATDIRYTYYKETHKILGNTFGMCVLQVHTHSTIHA